MEINSNFWTSVAVAVVAPVIGFLAAVWKIRREGISLGQLEEIKDRATFRQHIMDRVKLLEDRERELISRHESRERSLLDQIAELHIRIETLELELNAGRVDRRRIEDKVDKAAAEAKNGNHRSRRRK